MLNDTQIRNLKPETKPKKYADGGGLFLYIPPNGSKLWRLAYSFNGKAKLLSFGKYPIVSLKAARQKRDEAKRQLANGIDPGKYKKEMKKAAILGENNTFEHTVQEWHETQTVHNSAKDRERKIYTFRTYLFPTLGKTPISEITAQDLVLILKQLEQSGQELIAHRIIQYCNMVFRYAIATGRATRNVATDVRGAIRAHKGSHRATITNESEIGELLYRLENYHGHYQVKSILRLYPLLFVRSSELSCAEWREFNFATHEWHIPCERMKMRLPHIVPLSTQALAILNELHAVTGNGKFLFPSRNSVRKPIHYSTPLQALRALGYGKEEMCIHGFRSMASTLLNEQGYSPDWIERQLAHKEKDTSRIAYNHAQYLPQRHEMMQAWSDYLYGLLAKAKQNIA